MASAIMTSMQRKKAYDKCSKVRLLRPGDRVLHRKLGLTPKLEEAWSGPYVVEEGLNSVNYRIQAVDDVTVSRIAHINDLKTYNVEPSSICTLQMLADEDREMPPALH